MIHPEWKDEVDQAEADAMKQAADMGYSQARQVKAANRARLEAIQKLRLRVLQFRAKATAPPSASVTPPAPEEEKEPPWHDPELEKVPPWREGRPARKDSQAPPNAKPYVFRKIQPRERPPKVAKTTPASKPMPKAGRVPPAPPPRPFPKPRGSVATDPPRAAAAGPPPRASSMDMTPPSEMETCLEGHRLTRFTTRREGCRCSLCQTRVGAYSALWGCRICDYDVCWSCTSEHVRKRKNRSVLEER